MERARTDHDMTDRLNQTLGDIVKTVPAAARVFERAGLDYCCRGQQTLARACEAAGLHAAAVATEIDALDPDAAPHWVGLSLPDLADHIVAAHHTYLRKELPLLDALAAKVVAVHGDSHPELHQVEALVNELHSELIPHLDKEERVLFPAIRALEDAGLTQFPFGSLANPIGVMLTDHDRDGELLEGLRHATAAYRPPVDACASYRSLYDRLSALEHDIHVHIHKENHVLFPAALREWNAHRTSRQEVGTR
jgi:regulator of cell morphogenesis and NO signaling